MINYLVLALSFTAILFTGSKLTAQGSVLHMDKARTIKVIDVVDNSLLSELPKLESLTPRTSIPKLPVYLLVNSPGGMVSSGTLFIQAMERAKLRGYKFHCVSTVLAASMAFQILAHCDRIYAMQYTKLLFHPPRVVGGFQGLTPSALEYMHNRLTTIEADLVAKLMDRYKINADVFDYHYHAETFWDAKELVKYTDVITLVDDITGLDNSYQFTRQRQFFFGSDLGAGTITYISPYHVSMEQKVCNYINKETTDGKD